MKNKFLFLMAILSIFLALGTSQTYAYSTVVDQYLDDNTNGDNLANSGEATELAWLIALLDSNPSDSIIPAVTFLSKESWDDSGVKTGFAPTSWAYAIMKFGGGQGNEGLITDWAISFNNMAGAYLTGNVFRDDFMSLAPIKTVGNTHPHQVTLGLSHISYFGSTTTVPEPATMLLLGTSLIGLAAFGRRRFLKKG